MRRTLRPPHPVDLALTLAPLRHGHGDRTIRIAPGEVWRATRTPDGPATLRLRASGSCVEAEAWGPGAERVLDAAADLAGCADDDRGFAPDHPLLRDTHRRNPGLRMARTGAVVEMLVPTVLGQKVTGHEQRRGWQRLVRLVGEPAPGPSDLLLPPSPAALAALPYHRFHPLGVERRRADTIRAACARAGRLEEAVGMDRDAAARRLTAVPGIGPWTAAIVARVALGDADAVEVGDFHLPNIVSWNLAGEPRGDDARMLELLEPYRGHRGRVVRLLAVSGRRAPRYGPRLAPRSFERC